MVWRGVLRVMVVGVIVVRVIVVGVIVAHSPTLSSAAAPRRARPGAR